MIPAGSEFLQGDTHPKLRRWRAWRSFLAVFVAVPLLALIFTALQKRFGWPFSDSTFLLFAFGVPLAIYHTLARRHLFIGARGVGRHAGQVTTSLVLACLTLWATFLLLAITFGFGAGL